jgi:hypothetical protein
VASQNKILLFFMTFSCQGEKKIIAVSVLGIFLFLLGTFI